MNTSESKKSPIKKFLGCACGAILLIVFAIFALANYLGIHAEEPSQEIGDQSTPLPRSAPVKLTFSKIYLGKWQSKDGTSIHIRQDGKGDFHWQDTDVSGGILVIDTKKKILKISSVFDLSKQWKIDRAPQTKNGKTTMILNKTEFQRAP